MKINLCLPLIGVGLALFVGGVGAQTVSAPLDAPKSKFVDSMANPQLLALRDQLAELVLAKYPDAKVEFLGDALVIRRRSTKFETHLFTPFDNTFPTDGIQFPADFDEFAIRVSAADIMADSVVAVLQPNLGTKEHAYGTSDSIIYAWKSAGRQKHSFYINDIPMTSWVYPVLHRLAGAGLIENWNSVGPILNSNRPFTSYEVMVAVARALDKEESRQKLAAAPQNLKEDFANLRIAFPTEYFDGIAARDANQNAKKQVLWMAFAYGKGVDAKFVADVKQTIADYAAKELNVNY